jgi:hypothetical protein
VKHDLGLKIAALLSAFLFALHVAQDVVRGFEPGDVSNYPAVFIFGGWVYAAVVLVGKRWGYVIVLLLSVMGTAVPYLHMRGQGLGRLADSDGALLFILALLALGTTSLVSVLLCVHGLVQRPRRTQEPAS